jgi:hypothetical protein
VTETGRRSPPAAAVARPPAPPAAGGRALAPEASAPPGGWTFSSDGKYSRYLANRDQPTRTVGCRQAGELRHCWCARRERRCARVPVPSGGKSGEDLGGAAPWQAVEGTPAGRGAVKGLHRRHAVRLPRHGRLLDPTEAALSGGRACRPPAASPGTRPRHHLRSPRRRRAASGIDAGSRSGSSAMDPDSPGVAAARATFRALIRSASPGACPRRPAPGSTPAGAAPTPRWPERRTADA